MKETKNEKKPRIDYDGQWKIIIMVFFPEFMAFFLPELLPDVDMTRPPEFLEQELAKIIPEKTAKGRKSIDKLVKIWLKNGEEKWLFIHIEVQSWDDPDFMERMFTYFYRIYDSKGKVTLPLRFLRMKYQSRMTVFSTNLRVPNSFTSSRLIS